MSNNATNQDIITLKFNGTTGAVEWSNVFNYTANKPDLGLTVAVLDGGDVVTAGTSGDADNTTDIFLARYSGTDGATVWETRYEGLDGKSDSPSQIITDGTSSVYVAGWLTNVSSVNEALMLKYGTP